MRKSFHLASSALALCLVTGAFCSAAAQGAPAQPAPPSTPADTYGSLLTRMEKQLTDLADAMPADKFDFKPTGGEFGDVRTFSGEVKHLADANAFFFADKSKTPAQTPPDLSKLKTKAEILDALKSSFTLAHSYVAATTPENAFAPVAGSPGGNRAGTISFALAHAMDHYGQMVVYLRMNGIVPPASRKK